jgi:hypothetical protein
MKLTDLITENEEAPVYIGDIFVSSTIRSLNDIKKNFPGYSPGCVVRGFFDCGSCSHLKNLIGAPSRVIHDANFSNCKLLSSLEGAPTIINKNANFDHCIRLSTLKGGPVVVGSLNLSRCYNLTSLEFAPERVDGNIYLDECVKLTKILILLKTTKFENVICSFGLPKLKKAISILNENKDNILAAQKALIKADLREYATL